MAEETYEPTAGPGDSGTEYEYGGGTGDYERGEYNPGTDGLEDTDLADDGELDASDTLEGDPGDDPLDTGIAPAGPLVGRGTLRHHAGRGAGR